MVVNVSNFKVWRRKNNAAKQTVVAPINPAIIIHDESNLALQAAESRYSRWKQAVIESHKIAGVVWVQPMDGNFRQEDVDDEAGEATVKFERPWYADKGKIKKGAVVALIRMHGGNRVSHLYQLIAPTQTGGEPEWRCRYINSNALGSY